MCIVYFSDPQTTEIYTLTLHDALPIYAYGDDTMPSTAENVAQEWQVSREDQDAFAVRSQEKASAAQENGRFAAEIVPVIIPQRKGDPIVVDSDEHPRKTIAEGLAKLKPIVRADGTVTLGKASGVQ